MPRKPPPRDPCSIEARVAAGPRPFERLVPPLPPHHYAEIDHAPPRPRQADFAWQWNGLDEDNFIGPSHLRAYRPLIVSIWMKKGGVGKTSTTLNLAHALACSGKRTMMVGFDAQQDLTEQCFRAVSNQNEMDDVQEYLETQMPVGAAAAVQTCSNLKDALRYVLGRGQMPSVPQGHSPSGLLVPYPFPVKRHETRMGNVSSGNVGIVVKNLFHVQDGIDFEEAETLIHSRVKGNVPGNVNIPGAMFHAIWNAGMKCNAEVILIDLAPALGSTTELAIMHSDYFLTPCENNRFSEKNLSKLAKHVKKWYKEYAHHFKEDRGHIRDFTRGLTGEHKVERKAFLPLPDIEPKFLGIILNKYEIAKKGAKCNHQGVPIEVHEAFKSRAQIEMACRMIKKSWQVSDELRVPPPAQREPRLNDDEILLGDEGIELTIEEKLFTNNGDGDSEFCHSTGSTHYPQYGILACVRKGPQHYELATTATGRPLSAIETEEELELIKIECSAHKNVEMEEIAHYRRIFDDVAKLISSLIIPEHEREPFNFVFDAKGAWGGAKTGPYADTGVLNELGEAIVVDGYPDHDDTYCKNVSRKRSARQVPQPWAIDD